MNGGYAMIDITKYTSPSLELYKRIDELYNKKPVQFKITFDNTTYITFGQIMKYGTTYIITFINLSDGWRTFSITNNGVYTSIQKRFADKA